MPLSQTNIELLVGDIILPGDNVAELFYGGNTELLEFLLEKVGGKGHVTGVDPQDYVSGSQRLQKFSDQPNVSLVQSSMGGLYLTDAKADFIAIRGYGGITNARGGLLGSRRDYLYPNIPLIEELPKALQPDGFLLLLANNSHEERHEIDYQRLMLRFGESLWLKDAKLSYMLFQKPIAEVKFKKNLNLPK